MNFRRWVVFTFLIHVLVVAVDKGGGIVLYLLVADHTREYGAASVIASLPFILGAVANLGLATSLVYFVRRGRFSPQKCFETALTVAVVWGGVVALAALAVTKWVLPALDAKWQFDPWLVVPWCLAVPLLLLSSYANSTQLATERVKDYGAVHLATSVLFLPAFFALYVMFGADAGHDVPYAVAWGRVASTAAVAAFALFLVRKVVKVRFGLDPEFLRAGVTFGWKANLTSTLNYLNHRIDLLIVGALFAAPSLLGPDAAADAIKEQVAFYSMAVTWAELVWHFPEAMRDLFFSKVAGSTHEQARMLTPVLSRLGLLISLVGGVAIVVLIDPIMGTITWLAKGNSARWYTDWSPAVTTALWILVPGTVAYTVNKVLQADLAARDRLQACVNAQVLVFAVMVGLDLWLVPEHGAVGASIASTVSYLAATVYSLRVYARQTGVGVGECLLVQRRDFRYISEIVTAVVRKVLRRSA